jgi:hypothetical protein
MRRPLKASSERARLCSKKSVSGFFEQRVSLQGARPAQLKTFDVPNHWPRELDYAPATMMDPKTAAVVR